MKIGVGAGPTHPLPSFSQIVFNLTKPLRKYWIQNDHFTLSSVTRGRITDDKLQVSNQRHFYIPASDVFRDLQAYTHERLIYCRRMFI